MPKAELLIENDFKGNFTDLFFNREISWLAFNERVLEEAEDNQTPLLDRLKFLSIFTTNLDEFFMVRVATLKRLLKEGVIRCETPDRIPIQEVLFEIKKITDTLVSRQMKCFAKVMSLLHKEGIEILKITNLKPPEKKYLEDYFYSEIFPVLTPLAVDPSHPYPFLTNISKYLLIDFETLDNDSQEPPPLGFVEVPAVLKQLIPISEDPECKRFVILEDLVGSHLSDLFLGYKIRRYFSLRVTRNLDYDLHENAVSNLLDSIQQVVVNRQHQEAVRLEVANDMPQDMVENIIKVLNLNKKIDVYRISGPIFIPGFMSLYKIDMPHLKEETFNPRLPARLVQNHNIFELIRQKDLLIHHPFESFYAVTEFLTEAANDKDVLAIKQTLYRSSGDSPIVESLIKAAENGKHVTAVIELKARFDEKNNIIWARRLERSGVNVVYGFVGLKTHCKATLIVRKEQKKLVRYVHVSTGNYNSQTAKLYTDIGLFTARPEYGEDISALFNLLTGFNFLAPNRKVKSSITLPQFNKIIIAPIDFRNWLIKKIDEMIASRSEGENKTIVAKVNALVDGRVIERLYRASQAGIQVKLIVRGICCLRPGIKNLSENIEVISIVDRFLEHSRLYHFKQGKKNELYLASADWMTRSMDRRIEMIVPIEDNGLKKRLANEILSTYFKDNQKSRILQPDGAYVRKPLAKDDKPFRCQERFIEIAREDGIKSIPYDKAVRYLKDKRKGLRPVANKRNKS